jgi:hypothetical protein
MTKTELRVHALTLAVQTTGQPNIMQQASVYLDFLATDLDVSPSPTPSAPTGSKRAARAA